MSSQNIYPKSCTYGCNIQIYWNTSENAYFEVFSQKRHNCPNRTNNSKSTTTTTNNKPKYYNNTNLSKSSTYIPKPKMSNSFELLTGPTVAEIQKKYEILSDIVIVEHNGKIHSSQKDRDPKTGLLDLLVYYEVPEGQREIVKQ